jgi:hypothetical protein
LGDPLTALAELAQKSGIVVPTWLSTTIALAIVVLFVVTVVRETAVALGALRRRNVGDRLRAISGSAIFKALFNFKVLLGVLVALWVVWISMSVSRMNDDIRHYVLPRQLTQYQKNAIADAIKASNKSQDVKLVLQERDEEAAAYGVDLREALEKGGWPVFDQPRVPNLQPGMSLAFRGPESHMTNEERVRARARPPEATSYDVLMRALKNAGVRIDGSTSNAPLPPGSASEVTIIIGSRRRDPWVVPRPPRGYREP